MNTETSDIQVPESPTPDQQKVDLTLEIQERSACERHVTVTVPREEIERYFQKQFDEIAPVAEVPGFRAGRAPRNIVEKKFRKQVGQQVKGSLLLDCLNQISESDRFSPISEPDLDFEQVQVPDEGPLTFEFDIEVRPEFDLPEYKNIKIARPYREFTYEDVASQIDRVRVDVSDLVPVDEPVQARDVVICDVTSTYEEKRVVSLGELTLTVLPTLVFEDATLEGFDELMIGASAGDSRSTTVAVSEFADNTELQGKEIQVEFDVLDVKRIEKKTDEEVAELVGFDSVGELRDSVLGSLENRLAYQQRASIRDQISASLVESADWELPPDLLRRQAERELQRKVMELQASGFDEQEIAVRENSLRQNILARTEIFLKEHFILERIAEAESIEETEDDYALEIARMAKQANDSPRRVRARLERNGQMDALRNMIIEGKVIDFITKHAEISNTEFNMGGMEQAEPVGARIASDEAKVDIPEARYDEKVEEKIPGVDTDRK